MSVREDQVSFNGTVRVDAEVDLTDAMALDKALQVGAEQLALAGSVDTLDGRRATALGEMAREQLALTYERGHDDEDPRVRKLAAKAGKPVTLFVHISDLALTGDGPVLGRCGNTRTPITLDTIRAWCGDPQAKITVKPILDLTQHVRVDHYEVPDRLKDLIEHRDGTCVFPWCNTRASRCDADHVIPHNLGGPTCTCNLAPLCRHHHRLKTDTPWRYAMIEPGVYVWTSPHGLVLHRDHTGTTDVTPPRTRLTPACPPDQ